MADPMTALSPHLAPSQSQRSCPDESEKTQNTEESPKGSNARQKSPRKEKQKGKGKPKNKKRKRSELPPLPEGVNEDDTRPLKKAARRPTSAEAKEADRPTIIVRNGACLLRVNTAFLCAVQFAWALFDHRVMFVSHHACRVLLSEESCDKF